MNRRPTLIGAFPQPFPLTVLVQSFINMSFATRRQEQVHAQEESHDILQQQS
jgi:hypothetical protein